MPDLDLDDGADAQDSAEAFDETNREDELISASGDDVEDPDIAEDVYDVTTAIGDADDEDGRQYDLDAADGVEDLDLDDLEEDEDEDESISDSFASQAEEDDIDNIEGVDHRIDVAAGRAAPSEPGLRYVDDIDDVTQPRNDAVEKYESSRELSDAQLGDLGYPDPEEDIYAMDDKAAQSPAEPRSFAPDGSKHPVHGSGATADDVTHGADKAQEDRLDEGLEETFPASDPVSAKHIT
jgi:hypothetical protein